MKAEPWLAPVVVILPGASPSSFSSLLYTLTNATTLVKKNSATRGLRSSLNGCEGVGERKGGQMGCGVRYPDN